VKGKGKGVKMDVEVDESDEDDDDDEDDDARHNSGKLRTRQKESIKRRKEEEIRAREVRQITASACLSLSLSLSLILSPLSLPSPSLSPSPSPSFSLFSPHTQTLSLPHQNALVDGTLVPENRDDFERLVIASPNSSYAWIQYMAFHLQSADVETARDVSARALRTIGFREEDVRQRLYLCGTWASESMDLFTGEV
jgi:rRNA biogenesis protein RRP5